MNRLVLGLVLLTSGCHAAHPSRDVAACSSVETITADPISCEGRNLILIGHLTFTRHGIYISDIANDDVVLSAFLSEASEHRTNREKLIALVRSQPPATSKTVFGRFEGKLIRVSGEKPRLEVFSAVHLGEEND